MLTDQHGREINYLRLAITDRCNLRCHYCMPEHGLDWLKKESLLTNEEIVRLCIIFSKLGITKILFHKHHSLTWCRNSGQHSLIGE